MDPKALIGKHEGRRRHAYKDSLGIWTIGIGHNLKADPTLYPHLKYLIDVGITDAQIDALFDHDYAEAGHHLDLYLPWWRQLDATRQAVLVDMTFNMGIAGLLKFHDFLAAMHRGDWKTARSEMLGSLWAKQVPSRANEDADLVHDEEDAGPNPKLRAA